MRAPKRSAIREENKIQQLLSHGNNDRGNNFKHREN